MPWAFFCAHAVLMSLSPKQQLFCDEYLVDRNGLRAYKAAYPNVKNDNTAAAAASRLLSNVNVKAYIDAKMAEVSEKAGITLERVLTEEGRIAFSDFRQLFDGWVTIAPNDLPDDIARAVAGVEQTTKPVFDHKGRPNGTETLYKYKLWDKGAALNRLHKYLGSYSEDKDKGLGMEALADKLAKALERIAK